MYKLFEKRYVPFEGTYEASEIRLIKSTVNVNFETVKGYFENSSFRSNNSHLLIRILRSMEVSLETPFERVVETTYARAPYVAKHFNLTSEGNYGTPHKNVFYSSAFNEAVDYIFYKSEIDINPFSEDKSWVNLSPIKVLWHPGSDFRMLVPNGELRTPFKGFSVVAIDIPLLVLQYREYCLEMVVKHETEAVYNPAKFLTTRVFPKMLKTQLDLAFFNKFLVKQGILEDVQPVNWLPIALLDTNSRINKAVNELYPKLQRSRGSYTQVLQTIPGIFQDNAFNALQLPDVLATRQAFWLQVLSRFMVVDFLFKLQGKKGREVNRGYIADFKRETPVFLNGNGPQLFQNTNVETTYLEMVDRFMLS